MTDSRGASAVEHALVISLVCLVALGAWSAFGDAVDTKVRCIAGALSGGSGDCDAGAIASRTSIGDPGGRASASVAGASGGPTGASAGEASGGL